MTETRNYYTTTRNYVDHSTFGGYVYECDFQGYHSLTNIAARIEADLRFDRQCKLNAQNRDKNKAYKKEGK